MPPNKLHLILRNRYYIGYVTWRGVEYQGRHETFVGAETFELVQEVLKGHRTSARRPSKRGHYLVGTVRCGRCKKALLFTVTIGRTGEEYGYFYCSSRLHGGPACGQRYLPAVAVEDAVESQWRCEQVPAEDLQLLRVDLAADFDHLEEDAAAKRRRCEERVHKLKRERFKWAEKSMEGTIPDDIARSKQQELAGQLLGAEAELARVGRLGTAHRKALVAVLNLIEKCGETYAEAPEQLRRTFNQAWFEALMVDETDVGLYVTDNSRAVFVDALRGALAERERRNENEDEPIRQAGNREGFRVIGEVRGSNVACLVVLTGLSSKQLNDLVNIGRVLPLASLREPSVQVRAVRQRRLTPTEQAEIVASYESGTSMAELASSYEVRRSTISQLLTRSGVKPRVARSLDAAGSHEAVRLYGEGQSLKRIGEQLGFDAETIRTHLKHEGIELRPARRPVKQMSDGPGGVTNRDLGAQHQPSQGTPEPPLNPGRDRSACRRPSCCRSCSRARCRATSSRR